MLLTGSSKLGPFPDFSDTRSGLNWTSKFSPVATVAVDLPVNHAVIAREVHPGHSSPAPEQHFPDLQARVRVRLHPV
jgi:hypothetical protein